VLPLGPSAKIEPPTILDIPHFQVHGMLCGDRVIQLAAYHAASNALVSSLRGFYASRKLAAKVVQQVVTFKFEQDSGNSTRDRQDVFAAQNREAETVEGSRDDTDVLIEECEAALQILGGCPSERDNEDFAGLDALL
jgi:hypothetical protein